LTRAVDHQWQSRENGHSAETPPKEVSIPAKCALPAHPIGAGSGTYDRTEAARRLWQSCRAIEDTHAEAYLRARALHRCRFPALRFHPALNYRDSEPEPWPRGGRAGPANRLRRYPALVAAVTGDDGALASIHRTWLDPSRPAKAPVAQPRKALGRVHGFAVRFGHYAHTLLVGEGIETVLSLVTAMPDIPAAAALSAGSLVPSRHRPSPPVSSSLATTIPRAGAPPSASCDAAKTWASPPPSSFPSAATSTTT